MWTDEREKQKLTMGSGTVALCFHISRPGLETLRLGDWRRQKVQQRNNHISIPSSSLEPWSLFYTSTG